MKGLFSIAVGMMLFASPTAYTAGPADAKVVNGSDALSQWKDFHSVGGKCTISLPNNPEHVRQLLPMPEEGYNLQYDVYVSAFEKKAVYMMLIAQYPPHVDERYADQGLESFLNGILSQNPKNKLIFADITEVQGHKALDFFIETSGVFFKGRAVMAQNNLYLLAMECESGNYVDQHYNYFINSFKLLK